MEQVTQTGILIRVTKQRNFLLYATTALLLSIIIMATTLLRQERVTVVVPGYTGGEFTISSKGVSREYLELVSRDVISTILNITPYNYDFCREKILKMTTPESYGKVKYDIEQMVSYLKTRQISLRYTPISMELDEKKLEVDIGGYLTTYVGVKQTENIFGKYRIGFEYRGGILMLAEFREITKEMVNSK